MIYTCEVLEILEDGSAVIELPDQLMKDLGWEVGDQLDIDLKDGQIFVRNISKSWSNHGNKEENKTS